MLSKTLQNPEFSSTEGHENAKRVRSDSDFDLFWEKAEVRRVQLDVAMPQLSRELKMPNTMSKEVVKH